jgi:hypothetical protein
MESRSSLRTITFLWVVGIKVTLQRVPFSH